MALCPYLTVELVTAYVATWAFEPLSDAAAVNDTYICQFTFTDPPTHVIAKQPANQHPRKRATQCGGDCFLRTFHLTSQAYETAAIPPWESTRISRYVPSWADLHAQAASGALRGIHAKQPAVDVLHQPAAGQSSLEAIDT